MSDQGEAPQPLGLDELLDEVVAVLRDLGLGDAGLVLEPGVPELASLEVGVGGGLP